MRKLSWIIGLVLVAVVVAGVYLLWPRPGPRQILERMQATIRNAEALYIEGEYVFSEPTYSEIDVAKTGMYKAVRQLRVAYQSPNRIYFYTRYEEGALLEAACDGQNAYLRNPPLKQVVKSPAPENLRKVRVPEARDYGALFAWPSLMLDIWSFLQEAFDLADPKSVRTGLPAGSDWLASLDHPVGTWVLTVNSRDETASALVLWVDKDTYLPRQAAMEVRGWDDSHPGIEGETVLMTHLQTWEHVLINEPIPEEIFSMELPEDVQIIEVHSVEEMGPAWDEVMARQIEGLRGASASGD